MDFLAGRPTVAIQTSFDVDDAALRRIARTLRYAETLECVVDLRNAARSPPNREHGLEFVASSRAWCDGVRRYGKTQSNIFTYTPSVLNGGDARRCELPVYACMCTACMQRRVDNPEAFM